MPTALGTTMSVSLDAPIQKVWEAITRPEVIKQWFFGVDTATDWKEGSSIVHTGEWQGKPYEDRGTIVTFEPPRKLVHTHWSPMSELPDREENYQTVSWELSERSRKTDLTIKEQNLPSEKTKSVSEKTWKLALDELKKVVEA